MPQLLLRLRLGGSKNARDGKSARRSVWMRRAALAVAIRLLAVCLPISAAWAATQYLYDDLGRLVLVANPSGSIVYAYDASGNVSTITQLSAASLSVTGFTPAVGYAGLPITIYGNSFSTTPANDHVTIGGVTATVTAATTTTLSTTIPYGAATGPISVTVNSTTATSSQNLVVKVPTITSFAPTVVNPGAAVTLNGNNLNLVGSTAVSVGGSNVTVTSLSNTQAVFTAPSGNGWCRGGDHVIRSGHEQLAAERRSDGHWRSERGGVRGCHPERRGAVAHGQSGE